jgi:hypothetical protein
LEQVLKSGGDDGNYIPRGSESGRQQQRKNPGFPRSYRDVWNATGRSFVLARRLRWLRHSVGDESAASVCGAVGLLKNNPAFRALKLDPQHSIDAILRRERESRLVEVLVSRLLRDRRSAQQTESTITAAVTFDGAWYNTVQVKCT